MTLIYRHTLKLVRDEESVNIYIDNGDDQEPTHIVYWHIDELYEDFELVAGAINNAVMLYETDPQRLFDTLGYDYLVV